MIYPLDEPLYSKYIKPLVDVINKYLVGDGVMIYVDTTCSNFIIQFHLLLEGKKTRTRVMSLIVTNELEITCVSFRTYRSLEACMKRDIREIVPQARVSYTYIYKYVKRRTAI